MKTAKQRKERQKCAVFSTLSEVRAHAVEKRIGQNDVILGATVHWSARDQCGANAGERDGLEHRSALVMQ